MTSSRSLRWAVPAAAVGLVAGVTILPSALASDNPDELSPRTAQQLLLDVAGQRPTALSGTVVQTSRLGLPELPGTGGATGPLSLATGSHTLRVWADGPERLRIALLGTLDEYNVVRSGRDVWTYSSSQDEAVHRVLAKGRPQAPEPAVTGAPSTPAEAADAVLAAIDPTTAVMVDGAVTVAGRTARQLVLTPRDDQTLVGSVRLAVDAKTSTPLRVQVFSSSDDVLPAVEVGFTDVTFEAPDPTVFDFIAPPGATVVEKQPTARKDGADEAPRDVPGARDVPGDGARPTVLGKGWSSVLVVEAAGVEALKHKPLLDQLTRRVPEGRLLTSALVSALLTDDGRLLVGAVRPAVLQNAA